MMQAYSHNPFVQQARLPVLNGGNYEDWALAMELAIGARLAWEVVSGDMEKPSEPKSGESRETIERWIAANNMAYFLMLSNMNPRLQKQYRMKSPNAKQLWDRLEKDHTQKLMKDVHSLRSKLRSITLEDCGKVEVYASKIQQCVDKFNLCASPEAILCASCRRRSKTVKEQPTSSKGKEVAPIDGESDDGNFVSYFDDEDDVEIIAPISRHEHVYELLRGLPQQPEWNMSTKLIKQKTPSIMGSPAKVIDELLTTEYEILNRKGFSQDAVLFTKKQKGGNKDSKSSTDSKAGPSDSNEKKQTTCYHCQRKGHMAKDCYAKARGEPPVPRPDKKGGNDNQQKNEKSERAQVASGETMEKLWMAEASGNSKRYHQNDWFLDGGCTTHLCGNLTLFTTYEEFEVPRKIKGFDGRITTTNGKGSVMLKCRLPDGRSESVRVTNVFYIPGAMNLVSQSKLMDADYIIENVNHYGQNVYTPSGELVATAPQIDGLFCIDLIWPDGVIEKDIAYDEIETSPILAAVKQTGVTRSTDAGKYNLWHRRLAHLGTNGLRELPKMVLDVPAHITESGICNCDTCVKGKLARKPFKPNVSRATRRLELVHSDLCGPMPRSIGGGRYILVLVDDASRMTDIYILRTKSEAKDRFIEWKTKKEKECGNSLMKLRTDNGGEFTSTEFEAWLASEGIEHQLTTPYTSQSNGVAERALRTIFDRTRCLLADAGLSQKYWAFAATTAVYLKNRSPSAALSNLRKTPFEAWHGFKPSLKHLRVWGCLAFVQVPNEKRKKLDFKAVSGIFVGYHVTNKQYSIYDPIGQRLHRSRDVVFREDRQYRVPVVIGENDENDQLLDDHFAPDEYYENQDPWFIFTPPTLYKAGQEMHPPQATNSNNTAPVHQHDIPEKKPNRIIPREEKGLESNLGKYWKSQTEQQASESGDNASNARRRLRESALLLSVEDEEEEIIPLYCAAAKCFDQCSEYPDGVIDPKSYNQALDSPQKEKWEQAIREELESIKEHEVFADGKLVELPKGRNAIPSHWVFKAKRNENGNITRYKARLVAGGNRQVQDVDYSAVYAPTARMSHVRLVLALAAIYDLEIHQMDVMTAFLGGALEEEIYMHPPQGFFRYQSNVSNIQDPNKEPKKWVLRLSKSLYGLKQSANVWYGVFRQYLVSTGFRVSGVDGGFFIKYDNNKNIVAIIVLWVDDLLIVAKPKELISLKLQLSSRFKMHDLGEVKFYLGMKIERDRKSRTIYLSQMSFAEATLSRFGMSQCKPLGTPMAVGKLSKRTESESSCDETEYQSILGSLMYLSTTTRPDLAYALGKLSRYSHNPSQAHMKALKHVLRYLSGTKDMRLCLGGDSDTTQIKCYVDASYADDPDDFRSTSGLVISLGGAVDWRSRKQKSTAQSSTDAEYYAFGVGCMRLAQINHLMSELKGGSDDQGYKPVVYNDNQGCLQSIRSGKYRGTTVAHIATKYQLAVEMVQNGEVSMEWVPTDAMIADIVTKPLPRPAFIRLCGLLGLVGKGIGKE
ncbi:MAG: DDE-type integrase/transposase/recombinase [Chitinophagaceae bacterium]|nr:DDE-type integrase/transposase/recombinase [Anaerolineae bacterium]